MGQPFDTEWEQEEMSKSPYPKQIADELDLAIRGNPRKRKIIQISSGPHEQEGMVSTKLYALCDDGTVWVYINDGWYHLDTTIPEREALK